MRKSKASGYSKEMEGIIRKYGFQESVLRFFQIDRREWAFMKKVGTARILRLFASAEAAIPDQQRWLKSIIADRRISLFQATAIWREPELLEKSGAAVRRGRFLLFDRFKDGDDYNSKQYRENFRSILQALEKKQALFVAYEGKRVIRLRMRRCPIGFSILQRRQVRLCSLEYSRGISDGN